MEKKPASKFFRVMSVLLLFESVIGILLCLFAVLVMWKLSEPAGPLNWLSLIVTAVCSAVNIVLAVMAMRHRKLDTVLKVLIFTIIFPIVFNSAGSSGTDGWISNFMSQLIPFLFYVAVFTQNRADKADR